jgi:hypothetical protein
MTQDLFPSNKAKHLAKPYWQNRNAGAAYSQPTKTYLEGDYKAGEEHPLRILPCLKIHVSATFAVKN